ncbi:Recombinase [Desulfofarcimen acetoxidans DSM 771]|uniref:Recombinase n=1 Tax=Desulfofarcimen acetoxidans (strain ATCC 49208 / DSM 771 / KCTC 5769 / VKM B-1644 / 5575) TaxID=485916 RepID=C8VXI6_DESAS|nr:recombinase zinc beta ribbon domain-containing protein [Desulfofarcimen acetoxidans]ACV64582.1 Recombinase [Desulfofarcimen acetoxidans DSM 771]
MKIPYGFTVDNHGKVTVEKTQAQVIQMIFREYLNGNSLGGLARMLESRAIPSPSGNKCWGRAAIDKLLFSSKYVPLIISLELYTAVQFEKAARSNQELRNNGSTQRKATRYNSQNVLSGLLICAECGANYRRITRASGEVVWRCANRVERRSCTQSLSIAEQDIILLVCNELSMHTFDAEHVRNSLNQILINHFETLSFEHKHMQRFSIL